MAKIQPPGWWRHCIKQEFKRTVGTKKTEYLGVRTDTLPRCDLQRLVAILIAEETRRQRSLYGLPEDW